MATPALEEIDTESITDYIKTDFKDGVSEVNLLMIGKCGTGKTSLANAILSGKSSGGAFGPKPGTTEAVVTSTDVINGVPVKVHDIRGLYDGTVSSDTIIQAVQQQCPVENLSTIFLCFKFFDRLDAADKKVFSRLHQLGPDIWNKVVVALTFCDYIPPEMKDKSDDEKREMVEETWLDWEKLIKYQLRHLRVSLHIIDNIQIVPTTSTMETINAKCFSFFQTPPLEDDDDADPGCFPWLRNLWHSLLQNAINHGSETKKIVNLNIIHQFYKTKCPVAQNQHSDIPEGRDELDYFQKSTVTGTDVAVVGTGVGLAGAMGGTSAALAVATALGAISIPIVGWVLAGVLGCGALLSVAGVVIYIHHRRRR